MTSKGNPLPTTTTIASLASANTAFHTPRRGSATARFELIAEQLSRPTRINRGTNYQERAHEADEEADADHDDIDDPLEATEESSLDEHVLHAPQLSTSHANHALPSTAAATLRPLPPALSTNITRLAMCMAMDDVVRARVAGMLPDVLGTSTQSELKIDRRPLPSPPSSTWSEIYSDEWRSPSHHEVKESTAKKHFTTPPRPAKDSLTQQRPLPPPPLSGPLTAGKGLPWVAYENVSSHGTPNSDTTTSTKRSTWTRVDSKMSALDGEGSCHATHLDIPPSPSSHHTPEVPMSNAHNQPAAASKTAQPTSLQAARPLPINISSENNLLPSPATSPKESTLPSPEESNTSLFGWISDAMDNLLLAGLVAGEERTRIHTHPKGKPVKQAANLSTSNSHGSPTLSSSSAVSAEERTEYMTSFATAAAFVINAALLYAISSKLHVGEILEEAVIAIQRAWAKTVGSMGEMENTETRPC